MSAFSASELMAIREENEDSLPEQKRFRSIFTMSTLQNESVTGTSIKDVKETEIEQVQRFAGAGVGVASLLTESLLAHPCIVLRRQCQVHGKAFSYHLTPFTLLPVIIKLQRRQGFGTLWKGTGGVFIIRGVGIAIETAIAEFTPFPREISWHSSLKQLIQHLALKGLTYIALTPFYCASLVETVQSDIASEKPGVLDCVKEAFCRIFRWGTPKSTRLLPVWLLIGPTAVHGVFHYAISCIMHSVTIWFLTVRAQRKRQKLGIHHGNLPAVDQYLCELTASFMGNLTADVLLFPAETVLHRLYLQGTRTIIDNLDYGTAVIPITTTYESMVDCFQTIVQEEGASGLYKGFGALVLQYSLHASLLKITKFLLTEITIIVKKAKSRYSN